MIAGPLLAQAVVPEHNRSRALGLFNAGFLLPPAVGPGLGEWLLHHYGDAGFFAAVAAQAIGALVLTLALTPTGQQPPPTARLSGIVARPADLVTGAGDGRHRHRVCLRAKLPRPAPGRSHLVLGAVRDRHRTHPDHRPAQSRPAARAAIGCLGAGLVLLGFGALLAGFAEVSGGMFGIGYGIVGPAAMAWGTAPYSAGEAARARPLALLTLAFQAGTILTAQTVGVVAPFVGWPGVLVSLGTCVAVVFLVVVATGLQILEKAL